MLTAGRDDPLVPLTDDESSDEEVPPTTGTTTALQGVVALQELQCVR